MGDIDKTSINFVVGEITTKLEVMDEAAKERHTEVMKKFTAHDERISKLEKFKHWIFGSAAIGGSGGLAAWWNRLTGT